MNVYWLKSSFPRLTCKYWNPFISQQSVCHSVHDTLLCWWLLATATFLYTSENRDAAREMLDPPQGGRVGGGCSPGNIRSSTTGITSGWIVNDFTFSESGRRPKAQFARKGQSRLEERRRSRGEQLSSRTAAAMRSSFVSLSRLWWCWRFAQDLHTY